MDMKNYHFKDTRKLFKWVYMAIAISILINILFVFTFDRGDVAYSPVPFAVSSSIVPIVIFFIARSKTRDDVYAYENKLVCGKTIHYMMITEITVANEIIIKADSNWMTIKLIDLENNFDEYQELLKYILERVDKKVAARTGSAEKLLQSALDELKTRYSAKKLPNGKVELGGWLTWFNISAYLRCIGNVFMILSLFLAISMGDKIPLTGLVQQLPSAIISIFIIILLHRRKKNVKYWLAALPTVTLASTIIRSVQSIIGHGELIYIILEAISIVLSIVYAILLAKIYIDYIDNFDRPKQTLIN